MKTKILISILVGIFVIPFVSSVLAIPANDNAGGPERVPVFIGFRQTPGPSEQALVRSHGGAIKYSYHLVPAIAASIPEPAIEGLRRNPNVTYIEPVIKVYAVDAELDNTWGVKHIGVGTVHESGNTGAGVKVAIIDTGIDYTHPDLDDNCTDENDDGIIDGYDFVNDDDDPMDDAGHGTHVAGTVAAEDNGEGVVGVAPGANLYALKVLGASGGGDYSDVIAALQWATVNGIQVTNNSYGSSGDPGTTVEAAFNNCPAVHVCAAGNNGNPPARGDNVIYPARYASCIAVAATDTSDSRANWSSTGPDVELSAPGVAINSTLLGGGYGEKQGTSMASPHVAGVAALVIASDITYVSVRTRLQDTADYLGDPLKYGWGLVNAAEAAGVSEPPPNNTPTVSITSPADGSTFDSGATISFLGTASDPEDGDLTETLIWTSDKDGKIGTGGSFSTTTLSDGNHTIIATVTDFGGATGSASISITVGTSTPPSGVMHVADIAMSLKRAGKNVNAIATVTIVDADGDPVADALVSGQWSGLTDDIDSNITNANGIVSISSDKVKNASGGTFTFTVDEVFKQGWYWIDGDITGSIIVP
ncbi:MAG: S8 family peptidase [Planctomycetes bacterium]|nr:S8 family peptidase [Planctomycetota bacterium]